LSDTLLLKTHADEYRWAEPDAYSEFVLHLHMCSILTVTQFRTWTRYWRLELGLRKLATVFRATFSRRKRLVSTPIPYLKTHLLESCMQWFAPTRSPEPLPHALPSTRARSCSQGFFVLKCLFITVLIYDIQFLTEAIEISRLAGDKETLQHCQGCVCHRTYTDSCLVMSQSATPASTGT